MSRDAFELVWEAVHPSDSGFCGGRVDTQKEEAFLLYQGDVARKGALLWQRTEMVEAAEVVCVTMGEDEPRWATPIGESVDFSNLQGDDVYKALVLRAIGLSETHMIVASRYSSEEWDLFALERNSGGIAWTKRVGEPQAEHLLPGGQHLMVASPGNAVELVDTQTGEAVRAWSETMDETDAVVDGNGVAFATAEQILVVSSREVDGPLWRVPFPPMDCERLSDRVVLGDDFVAVLLPNCLVSYCRESGEERWRVATQGGMHQSLACAGPILVRQDISANENVVYNCVTGEECNPEGLTEMMHWVGAGDHVVGSCVDGGLGKFEVGATAVDMHEAPADLRLLDVVPVGDRLYATAIRQEDEPLFLVEWSLDKGTMVRQVQLPIEGGVALSARDELVLAGSATAIFAYR